MKAAAEMRVLLRLRRAFAKDARVRSGLVIEIGEKDVRVLADQAVLLQLPCRESS